MRASSEARAASELRIREIVAAPSPQRLWRGPFQPLLADVQRAGPSTGMPTKNEQADLLQVMFGRNGDSPMPVVAPATPSECFDLAIEASRIALKYMTPVTYLSDAFLATGAEPWRIPDLADLPDIGVSNWTATT